MAEKWGGPGPPKESGPPQVTVSNTYFNGVFDIKSDEKSIRKVPRVRSQKSFAVPIFRSETLSQTISSVFFFRLRRATAAQRPSILRKLLYIDVLPKKIDFRGAQGSPRFSGQK